MRHTCELLFYVIVYCCLGSPLSKKPKLEKGLSSGCQHNFALSRVGFADQYNLDNRTGYVYYSMQHYLCPVKPT